MQNYSYIYTFKYDIHNHDLCKLESRQLFNAVEEKNLLFSNVKVDPSISPFIKSRFEIIASSNDFSNLLRIIRDKKIYCEGFKAEYLLLHGDSTRYSDRLEKLRDIGFVIGGRPNVHAPSQVYSISYYDKLWYFGILEKHNTEWLKHKGKPCSFSMALNMDIAKTLVCIASQGNKSMRLLDACCGVGTVMLEACIGGFKIDGCDSNWKAYKFTTENLLHFDYKARVFHSDIKELDEHYDAAIIDLPYNLYSFSNDASTLNILKSVVKLTSRVIIVSTSDIKPLIALAGMQISDYCSVAKKGKKFARNIWVCEKVN